LNCSEDCNTFLFFAHAFSEMIVSLAFFRTVVTVLLLFACAMCE
jgi:hypothetical protein